MCIRDRFNAIRRMSIEYLCYRLAINGLIVACLAGVLIGCIVLFAVIVIDRYLDDVCCCVIGRLKYDRQIIKGIEKALDHGKCGICCTLSV